jgi:putative flavoprotein involved in K+ transport
VGSNDKPILDLNSLSDGGAQIVGRLMDIDHGVARFSGSLRNVCALADLKMRRLLSAIDDFIGDDTSVPAAEIFADTRIEEEPRLSCNLHSESIRTVIWATGFRPDYSWLKVPVLDRKGNLEHDGGVVASPGLYVLGLPLMRTRKSSFIFGIEDDARYVSDHLISFLQSQTRRISNGVHQHDFGQPRYRRSA